MDSQNRPPQSQNKPSQNRPPQSQNKPSQNRPSQNRPFQNRFRKNKHRDNRTNKTNKTNKTEYYSQKSTNNKSSFLIKIFLIIFSIILLFFVLKLGYYIYLDCEKMDLSAYLFSFQIDPCKKKEDIVRTVLNEKEVFHISDQIYTYEEAKCKCSTYNGRLATEKEIVDAYNKGANWCSYGWTDGVKAFYPVQEEFYDINVINNQYCGTPGINGGSFNENLKFGINCYGIKPKGKVINPIQNIQNEENICDSEKIRSTVNDKISSFNNSKWSEFD